MNNSNQNMKIIAPKAIDTSKLEKIKELMENKKK
jgi:hypothetical protein